LIEPIPAEHALRLDAVQLPQLIQNKIFERLVPGSHSDFSCSETTGTF
jgi:hypothetical protein